VIRGHGFGICTRFDYNHGKHTEVKAMGIHKSGSCPMFEYKSGVLEELQASGFIPKEGGTSFKDGLDDTCG